MSELGWHMEGFEPVGQVNDSVSPDRSFGQVLADIGINALQGFARGGGQGALAGAILGGAGVETPWAADAKKADMQQKLLEQSYRQNEQNFNNQQELFALNKQSKEAQNKIQGYNLALAQDEYLNNQVKNLNKQNQERLYKSLGVPLNSLGRAAFNENPAVNAYIELGTALEIADKDPAMGRQVMQNMGWSAQMNGDNLEGFSKDGKFLAFNRETLSKLAEKIMPQLRNGLKAAYTLGTDAQTMDQLSTKNMLMDKKTQSVYGSPNSGVNYGQALGDYEALLEKGGFTDLQKTTHLLSRTLQAAMVDGNVSQIEMQTLLPQFQAYMKDTGCEVMSPDGSIGNAKVKLGNGTEMSLIKFADGLKERDVIMGQWNALLDAKSAAKAANALKTAKEMEDLRYKKALTDKKVAEVKGVVGGEDSEVSSWDTDSQALYSIGKNIIKDLNVKLPEVEGKSKDDNILAMGIAYNQAEQSFMQNGNLNEAQKVFRNTLKDNDWKDSQIPDLWEEAGAEQEIAMLENRNRYLRDVMNKQREAGAFKSEMVTTADLPDASEIDQAIPHGVRIENKQATEYKRNIDRIGELRKKAYQRTQSKKQTAEYLKKRPEAGKRLIEAAKSNR